MIDLFDALHEENEINVILPRHQQGLIHATDGYDRSTGKTEVCLVTSGPVPYNAPREGCPSYTPDFIKLAESYGAEGIRVTGVEGIDEALIRARKNKSGPTVIEFIIGREEYGLPIVTPGNPLNEMILESEKMI